MLDANDLLNAVKKAAVEAVNAGQPSDFCYGKVVSTKPLKISVEQKMTLGAAQLVLTRNVTDFNTRVTVNWETGIKADEKGDPPLPSHSHAVSGTKTITIHNALQVGDVVVLLKKKGGQKYLILDRVVNM